MSISQNENDYFIFFSIKVDNKEQKFVTEAKNIKEVLKISKLTTMPNSAKELLGVVEQRGEIMAVFDLASIIANQKTEISDNYVIIVFDNRYKKFGFLVNYAEDIVEAKTTKIYQNNIDVIKNLCIDAFVEKNNELSFLLNFGKVIKKIII